MRVGVGEESSKWRSVRKNVNERVYAVFGSKFDHSKFVFKGSSRIFGKASM